LASDPAGRSPRERGSQDDRTRARRAGRRLALASIFEAEFGQRNADAVLERHLALEQDPEVASLSRTLVSAVMVHRDQLDLLIGRVAPQYPVVQLARMDRALLRCALGEVLHSPATPARVAIAEWVELARSYSGDPMRRLMNGVLGRVIREQSEIRPESRQEEGVSGQHVRAAEEDRRGAAGG
jgi:transcription antitermination protein NusB